MSEKIPYTETIERMKSDIDYIAEEAYQKGLHVGESKCEYCDAYQGGLDDAWACARKIFGYETDGGLPLDELRNVFGVKDVPFCTADIFRINTASEALAKIKAYEEQQKADAEIKVGDEVMSNNAISDHTGVVLALSPGENSAKVLENDGSMAWVAVNVLIKTGRHFNFLTPLLNEMKEGAE